MFVEEGEIGGAAADVFEEVKQPHQRIGRVVLLCRRLYEQRHNRVETRLGVCGEVAVFMAVSDLVEPRGDGFGIKPVFFQTALPLFFVGFVLPCPLPFAVVLCLFFGFAQDFVEQLIDLVPMNIEAV